MTSCQQSHELIDQCVTGAIAPADALALERHLAGCPLCARRLRWHQCITDELANQARGVGARAWYGHVDRRPEAGI